MATAKKLAQIEPVKSNSTRPRAAGTAGDLVLEGRDRIGLSRGARELLAALRRERTGRGLCVPSVARLARLLERSERQVQRLLRELSLAGRVVRLYRGGKGKRAVYFLTAPREPWAGFVELSAPAPLEALEAPAGAAPEALAEPLPVPAKGDKNVTLKPLHSLDLEDPLETQRNRGASSAEGVRAAPLVEDDHRPPPPPASQAGGARGARPAARGPALRSHLAMVWAVWRRVWQAFRQRAYRHRPEDGPAAVWLARTFGAAPGGAEELAWLFASYHRGQYGAASGHPLYLAAQVRPTAGAMPHDFDPVTLRRSRPAPAAQGSAGGVVRLEAPRALDGAAQAARAGALLAALDAQPPRRVR